MKRTFGTVFALALIVLAAAPPAATQGPDLYNATSPAGTIFPQIGLNSAVTGSWVSRAGYGSAYAIINIGHVRDSVTAARYVVLQDSVSGVAVANVDSVLADTVDNVFARIRYSGIKSHLRIVYRAGGVVRDTGYISASIVRGNARAR